MPCQEKDLRYDITQGYLQKEGAGQVGKEGVLHRGMVGASKRGRAGVGGGGRKKSRRQAAVPSGEQGGAVRLTQVQKGSRESPARMEKRARQRERPAAPIQAPRPAPGISKKTRPKNGDKEGQISTPRAAPRLTRAPGLWGGVRPRPGAVGRLWGHLDRYPLRGVVVAQERPGTLGGGLDVAEMGKKS